MKPKKPTAAEKNQLQLFQSRLDSQFNPDHPLVILAELIDWDRFDQAYEPLFCPDNGAPALPTRLMVGLLHRTQRVNSSDESPASSKLIKHRIL